MIKEYVSDIKGFYKRIFDNDEDLKNILYSYDIVSYMGNLDAFFYKVIEIFLNDERFEILLEIGSSKKIYEEEYLKYLNNLRYETQSPLYILESAINEEFEVVVPWVKSKNQVLYTQLLFTFMYGNVKSYFHKNRKRFLPEYDWFLIENNEKKKAHIEGFFREFDKFSDAISYMSELKDIDDAPDDKIAYISAVVGIKFDLEDDTAGYSNMPDGLYKTELFSVSKIRNLLKKIIEIFREKGNRYAYELFFDSIGIDVSLKETYFDRRLYRRATSSDKPEDIINPETRESRTSNFFYYITTSNPSTYFFNLAPNEKVTIKDMTEPKTESAFEYVVSTYGTTEEKLRDILGYGENYDGETFTFFKTNALLLDFKYYMAETQEESFISSKHQELIKSYIDMITPIYIKKFYPDFGSSETVFLERASIIFKSGSGYTGYYEDGVYKERSRSDGLSTNTYLDAKYDLILYGEQLLKEVGSEDEINGLNYEEKEGFPKATDSDYEDYKDSREIFHRTKNEETVIEFNVVKIKLDENGEIDEENERGLFSFENSEGNILNNIDFTWLPTISDRELEEEGFIEVDYYSYNNPIVAVAIQTPSGNDIKVDITEEN